MVDVLLRSAPHRQRTERERMQADEVYPDLRPFRVCVIVLRFVPNYQPFVLDSCA